MMLKNATFLTAVRFSGNAVSFLLFIVLSRRLRPETHPTPVHRVIDCLSDRWSTACQCVRHSFDRAFDLSGD